MKKQIIMVAAMLLVSLGMQAQIRVNSSGYSFFGSGTNNTNYGQINLLNEGTTRGISFTGTSSTRFNIFKYSDRLYITPNSSISTGIRMYATGEVAMGNGTALSSTHTGAVLNLGTRTTTTIWAVSDHSFAGGNNMVIYSYNTGGYNINAGQVVNGSMERTFYLTANGTVWAKNGYIQASDRETKTDMEQIESALDKISKLSAVSFNYKNVAENTLKSLENTSAEAIKTSYGEDVRDAMPEVKNETIEQMKKEVSRKRIGLIAQEVEEVVPEVVRTLSDGTKGIMYTDLIPLLIEAIKEMKEEYDGTIAELEKQIAEFKSETIEETEFTVKEISTDSPKQQNYKLYQNRPNPFNQQTEITYSIPQNANAYLGIYNLNGTQLKKYSLGNQSEGTITISASELTPGIYIYSLIVDGKEVDSKRMVLND